MDIAKGKYSKTWSHQLLSLTLISVFVNMVNSSTINNCGSKFNTEGRKHFTFSKVINKNVYT